MSDASENPTGIDVGRVGSGTAFAAGILTGGGLAVAASKVRLAVSTPPAVTPDPPPIPPSNPQPPSLTNRIYTVVEKDTPWKIAGRFGAKHYGYFAELVAANPQKALKKSGKGWKSLIAGEQIIIPWPDTNVPQITVAPTPAAQITPTPIAPENIGPNTPYPLGVTDGVGTAPDIRHDAAHPNGYDCANPTYADGVRYPIPGVAALAPPEELRPGGLCTKGVGMAISVQKAAESGTLLVKSIRREPWLIAIGAVRDFAGSHFVGVVVSGITDDVRRMIPATVDGVPIRVKEVGLNVGLTPMQQLYNDLFGSDFTDDPEIHPIQWGPYGPHDTSNDLLPYPSLGSDAPAPQQGLGPAPVNVTPEPDGPLPTSGADDLNWGEGPAQIHSSDALTIPDFDDAPSDVADPNAPTLPGDSAPGPGSPWPTQLAPEPGVIMGIHDALKAAGIDEAPEPARHWAYQRIGENPFDPVTNNLGGLRPAGFGEVGAVGRGATMSRTTSSRGGRRGGRGHGHRGGYGPGDGGALNEAESESANESDAADEGGENDAPENAPEASDSWIVAYTYRKGSDTEHGKVTVSAKDEHEARDKAREERGHLRDFKIDRVEHRGVSGIGGPPMPQSAVTPAMTTWASQLLASPDTFPIGSSETQDFDGVQVTAVAEIHRWVGATGEQRPDGLRGISLYYADPPSASSPDTSDDAPDSAPPGTSGVRPLARFANIGEAAEALVDVACRVAATPQYPAPDIERVGDLDEFGKWHAYWRFGPYEDHRGHVREGWHRHPKGTPEVGGLIVRSSETPDPPLDVGWFPGLGPSSQASTVYQQMRADWASFTPTINGNQKLFFLKPDIDAWTQFAEWWENSDADPTKVSEVTDLGARLNAEVERDNRVRSYIVQAETGKFTYPGNLPPDQLRKGVDVADELPGGRAAQVIDQNAPHASDFVPDPSKFTPKINIDVPWGWIAGAGAAIVAAIVAGAAIVKRSVRRGQ